MNESEVAQGLKEFLGYLSSVICSQDSYSPSVLGALKNVEETLNSVFAEPYLARGLFLQLQR